MGMAMKGRVATVTQQCLKCLKLHPFTWNYENMNNRFWFEGVVA